MTGSLSMLDILCFYPPFNLLDTLGLFHKWLGQLGFDKYPICRWSFHSTGGGVLLAPLCGFWWPSHNRGRDIVFVFLFAPLHLYLRRCICFFVLVVAVVNIVWLLATFTHNRGRDFVILYTWTALHSSSHLWQTKDKNWFLSLKTCFHPSIYINFLF